MPSTPATAAVALLARERVAFTVHEYAHDPAAASYGLEAAAALGRDPDQVFKTLLVVHERDWAVAVLPVSARLSLRAAAAALGWKRAALAEHASQETALSPAAGDEALLRPTFTAHFERPDETFLVEP